MVGPLRPEGARAVDRPDFDAIWQRAQTVEGWLTPEQGRALYEAAQNVRSGLSIVEIGSHCGRSTLILAAAKAPEVALLAVDPFDDPRWGGGSDTFARFQRTLSAAGVIDEVSMFRGTSYDASRSWRTGSVGMLYIDGAHDRSSVMTDIDGWAGHLSADAFIFLHDAFSSPGVTAALLQRYLGRSGVEYVGCWGSLIYLRRDASVTIKRRLVSSVRLLWRLLWFTRNLLVKVAMRRRWRWAQRLLQHYDEAHPY